MGNLRDRKGHRSCSLSSSDSLRGEGLLNRDSISRLTEVLFTPREAGGFGGSLRYGDLGLLLRQLGCTWSNERVDDCWYDMVRGRSDGVVNDMRWAAECIHGYLQGKLIQLPSQHSSRVLVFEDPSAPTPPAPCPDRGAVFLSPESRAEIPDGALSTSTSRTTTPLQQLPPREREPKNQRVGRRGSTPVAGHSVDSEKPRYAAATLSSVRRTRSVSAPSRRNNAKPAVVAASAVVCVSPRKRRLSPPQSSEVFQRLIEDARNRKSRGATSSPPETLTATSGIRTDNKRLDRSSSPPLTPRRPSPNTCRWGQPTKSYKAKLTPGPPSIDYLEADTATPHVTRQDPLGPSAFVPPGYVEAVARLRRFAASREHHQDFVNSLRSTSPSTPSLALQTPILRLPMQDDTAKKKIVVDVRLATPRRSRHLLLPRDIPFDDPSRVVIQDVLREAQMRCW